MHMSAVDLYSMTRWILTNALALSLIPVASVAFTAAKMSSRHGGVIVTQCTRRIPLEQSFARSMQQTDSEEDGSSRRRFLHHSTAVVASTFLILSPSAKTTAAESPSFERVTQDFGYALLPPKNFQQTRKPLPTHLDEVNFVSPENGSYQFGITVDPVRIESLKQFGTPEEVAARVVTAEVNRDGVLDVTLLKDPVVSPDGAYQLEYLSSGKRGNKHFLAKFYIVNFKLYVLTAQIKQEFFDQYQSELLECIESFRLL